MASPEFSTPPGIGEQQRANKWFSQVAHVNGVYETAGQTALEPTGNIASSLPAQMDQVFKNVDAVLKHAGCEGGWQRVYKMTSYHVGLDEDHKKEIVRCMKQWMPNHQPVWTMIGVERLAVEAYKVEVEVTAI